VTEHASAPRSPALRLAIATLAITVPALQPAQTQTRFVDDAGRAVTLPSRVTRVFAAGAPAEVLLYTLVPDRMPGRNRLPEGDAVEFFPPEYRTPTLIRQLPEVDNPAADAELVALKPDVYIDYGTLNPDYVASLKAVQKRTGVPALILDGALSRVPEVYRRLGTALGVPERGQRLAAAADALFARYRGSVTTPVRVYLACSNDGFVPCLEDDAAGEPLKLVGGVNVAGTRATAPRRPRTFDEIKTMAPDVIVVAGGSGAVERMRAHPEWRTLDAVAAGRVYHWPALPYSWSARPPSVNRLPGVVWLSYVLRNRPFDAAFDADIRAFYRDFYHLELSEAQLRALAPLGQARRWPGARTANTGSI
jgi:iron complex transport system substrate-binding protein